MKQKRAQVYMTNRAYIDVLTEVRAHPYVETGGLFVAARRENNYYLIEATDSGINARYLYARFDRDYAYTEHLGNIIAEKYDLAQGADMLLLQWHRHPDGCLEFSGGDRASNDEFARIYHGNISGLVTVSPRFRLKFWEIPPEGGRPLPIDSFSVDDHKVEKVIKLKTPEKLIYQIEKKEHPELFDRVSNILKVGKLRANSEESGSSRIHEVRPSDGPSSGEADFGLEEKEDVFQHPETENSGDGTLTRGEPDENHKDGGKTEVSEPGETAGTYKDGDHGYIELQGDKLAHSECGRAGSISEKFQEMCRNGSRPIKTMLDAVAKRKTESPNRVWNISAKPIEEDRTDPGRRRPKSAVPPELLEEMKEDSARGYQFRGKVLGPDLLLLHVTDPRAVEYEIRYHWEDGMGFLYSLYTGEHRYERGVFTDILRQISESDRDGQEKGRNENAVENGAGADAEPAAEADTGSGAGVDTERTAEADTGSGAGVDKEPAAGTDAGTEVGADTEPAARIDDRNSTGTGAED